MTLLGHITTDPTWQDSGWVFWITCGVIALMFLWGKLASYFNSQSGTIASLPGDGRGCRPESVCVPIRLWSGREIRADIDGCLICSLGLAAGDRVWVAETADGYVVIRAKGQSLRRLLRESVVDSSRECLLKRGR